MAIPAIPAHGASWDSWAAGVDAAARVAAVSVAATVSASGALAVGKHNPVDATAAARTMTLPTGQAEGTQVSVEKVDASTNAVAITGNVRGVGSSTISLVWQNEDLILRADSAGSWWPIAGHKTKASLDTAYVAATAGGNRVVALGDSLTQWQDNNPVNWRRTSWFPFASVMSKGQIAYGYNAGIGGNTTAQMLARFATDVAAKNPSTVVICGGRNDADATTTITNLQAIVAKVRGIGARPVLCTLPPCNDATTHVPDNTRNTWIRRYCAAQGIPLIDFRSALVDPNNGNYQAAYYNDGTHPNDAGFAAMAQAAITTLSPVLPPYRPHLTSDNTDAANLVGMPTLKQTISQLDAGPWNIPVSSGTRSTNKITDSTIQGDWVQIVDTGAAGTLFISQPLDQTKLIAGHTYSLAGRIKYAVTSGTPSLQAKVYLNGGTEYRAISDWTVPITDGVYYLEFTPTLSNVAWEIDIQVTAGGYDMRFAQPSVYDLTAMGLA